MAHPEWFESRMPGRTECVLSCLLARAQREFPDRIFAVFGDGSRITYADAATEARAWAASFQALGVGRGDRIVCFLPNGRDAVLTWFAANLLGAIFVPINVAYRGPLLAHALSLSGARVMVAHGKLVSRLAGIDRAALTHVICAGTADAEPPGDVTLLPSANMADPGRAADLPDDLMPWDTQSILFTSGTTGPSKGVLSSYLHQYTIAKATYGFVTPEDRIFVNGPLFHAGGTGPVYSALIHGASIALVDGFKGSTFWDDMRRTGSTVTSGLLGSMTVLLAKTAEDRDMANNPLRRTHFYPVTDETIAFAEAFRFEYFSGYGSTEAPLVLVTDLNTRVKGSCGRPRDGITCRLVDDHDCEVPVGEAGELIVRSDLPWSLTHGYFAMAEATVKAWRNGWFHTGDLLRRDEEGNYYFVDRKKDAIRRRGENISSQEVEAVVNSLPQVADCAVIGVPSDLGEDEVMVIIEPKAPDTVDPLNLFNDLIGRLPHFMLPRYIRIMTALPRTPTDKVQKAQLREDGVTADTWDRDKAGIRVKRETLDEA